MTIRPMLAAQKYREAGDLWGPRHEVVVNQHIRDDGYIIVQPKWDGFRMLHYLGIPMSRSGKPLANLALQKFVAEHPEWAGIDGEQFPGHQYHQEAFRQGMSETRSAGGSGDMMIAVYDYIALAHLPYTQRYDALQHMGLNIQDPIVVEGDGYNVHLILTPQVKAYTLDGVYAEEARLLALGFEGAITRRHGLRYKYNRATALGGELTKVKRRETYDAQVIGYEEGLENQNEAKTSELGFTTRSSHKANLVPNGRLGALHIRIVNGPLAGVEQKVGVFRGLSHTDLRALWEERETLTGRYIEVSVDPATGGYDAARCPVFVRFRPMEEF